jgi:hypothetical protein
VIFGVDVARHGKDSSIILVRKGPRLMEIQELKNVDTVELARWVAMRSADWNPKAIYIDAVGLGIGVVDELARQNIPNVYPINVSRAAQNPRKFHILRDELWWKLRERIQTSKLSFADCPDQQLISEISSIKYEVRDNGKIKIESKIDMRSRNMPSPNKGDALMLTMMADDKAFYPSDDTPADEDIDKPRRSRVLSYKRLNWLEV